MPLRGTCGSTSPVPVPHGLQPHLLYWNSIHDQSKGMFWGLSSNHKYMALSEVEPPQVPLWGTCSSMHPVRVPHGLLPHFLYWNSMRDQSKGLFQGLSSNPKYMVLSKVGPPQSECIARFTHTFSIGTPHATGPRGCFKGLV